MLIKFWANKQKQEFLHRDVRVRSMKCEKINSRNFFWSLNIKTAEMKCVSTNEETTYIIFTQASAKATFIENIGLRSDRVQRGPINSQCDPESRDLDHDHDHGLERTPVRISYWGSSTRLFTSNVLKDKRENKVGLGEEQKKNIFYSARISFGAASKMWK